MTTEPTFEKTKTTMCDRVCGDHMAKRRPQYRYCNVDMAFCEAIAPLACGPDSLRLAFHGYRRFSAVPKMGFQPPFVRKITRLNAEERDSLLIMLESLGAASRDEYGNWSFRLIPFGQNQESR